MRILLVEDHPTDAKLFTTVLRHHGHRVCVWERGEEAFEAIREQHPAVILLDLKLPGLDGLELARLLKADPATRDIPIIAVTAATETFTRARALAAGCDAYFVKPVDARGLPEQIRQPANRL